MQIGIPLNHVSKIIIIIVLNVFCGMFLGGCFHQAKRILSSFKFIAGSVFCLSVILYVASFSLYTVNQPKPVCQKLQPFMFYLSNNEVMQKRQILQRSISQTCSGVLTSCFVASFISKNIYLIIVSGILLDLSIIVDSVFQTRNEIVVYKYLVDNLCKKREVVKIDDYYGETPDISETELKSEQLV
ncbi:Hypothetical_protein [Hexamita inflata]|uniref:Hypothetical_protein n=1 Tax=Hexamita inflata TaxID=28002 RepID=A0AA86P6Y0_9EUKA|nr:Hypothetical protein HINF_LOCUS19254 [Hexamita inflata]